MRAMRRPIVWIPITAALVAFVLFRSGISNAGQQLKGVDVAPLLLAIALNVVIAGLWAARSALLLSAAGASRSLQSQLGPVLMANTLNNATPASIGEIVRLYVLRDRFSVPLATGGAVILIERFAGIALLGMSAALAWATYLSLVPILAFIPLLCLLAVSPRLGLGLPSLVAFLGRVQLATFARSRGWQAGVDAASQVADAVRRIALRRGAVVLFGIACGAIFLSFTCQLMLSAASFGVAIGPMAAWGALGLSIVAGVVSLLPFGLGATDLALSTLLMAMGVPALQATSIAFAYRLVATLPLGLAGAVAYQRLAAAGPVQFQDGRRGLMCLLAPVRSRADGRSVGAATGEHGAHSEDEDPQV